MNRILTVFSTLLFASAVLASAQAQSDALVKQDFKDSEGGWTVFGQSAKVAVSHDPAIVSPGNGALKFDYDVKKGEFNALVFPVTQGTLTRAKSLKFRARTDATTMLAVMLQERDGGRYVAICTVPHDKWQPIELSTDDFALSQDKGDPKDPDGKLDMDQVSTIAIGDVAQVLAQNDDPNLSSLLSVKTGSHSLYIDGFSVTADSIAPSSTSSKAGTNIDTFAHPQLAWYGIGGAELSISSGKPLDGQGLKVDYRQAPNKLVMVTRAISPGSIGGTNFLVFDAASLESAKLMVQVEDIDGNKFNSIVEVPGGSQLKHLNIPFDDFKVTDDSKDPNGKLDLKKVKSLLIIDLSGAQDQADHDNTLWINHVVAHT
jgi:hypothetical protein